MVQTVGAIKDGGGSVEVGTTGTISALMSKELETTKSASKEPSLSASVSVSDEASSSTSSSKNHKGPESTNRTKHQRSTHQIPMLKADDNTTIHGTPIRKKPSKKVLGVVEIVDIKCGNPDKAWANPITNRLKKLRFSKLSDSSMA